MYPISALILRYTSRSKKEKLNIVNKLGYKNLNKGLRRLDHLIQTGQCPDSVREKLPSVLGIDTSTIQEAFEATLAQQQDEKEKARRARDDHERKTFRPHLWVIHEREDPPVGSISIVAFIGIDHWKVITLPDDIASLRWSDQCCTIRKEIREHQSQEYVDRSMFGKVTGYLYRKTYEDSFLFNTEGIFIEKYRSHIYKPEIYLKLGNKKIRGGLLK